MFLENQNDKTGVGAIIISTDTHRILFNFRAAHKSHSLTWGLWGGMMEDFDDLPFDALKRELSEELGEILIKKIYPFDIFESKDSHFKFYTFVCTVDSEFVPSLNSESAGYAWVDFGQWPKPLHHGLKQTMQRKTTGERLKLIIDQYR